MHIYAHRGVSAHHPENTLAAFAAALELGVEGIELDVHLSGDGVPVVIHDATVDRTTDGTGPLSDFTGKQLGLLDAGAEQHVPTLEQVLRMAAGRARVNIEIKDPAAVAAVLAVAGSVPELDFFASSADWQSLAAIANARPGTGVYPLTFVAGIEGIGLDARGSLAAAIEFVLNHGGAGVSVWERGLGQSHIDAIHNEGLEAWVWTVNDVARARELQMLGADAICTDDPALLQQGLTAEYVTD